MAEPAARSLLIEVEHGQKICMLRLKGHFRAGENQLYLSDKTDEVKSHNGINIVADVRDLISICSMGMGFLVAFLRASLGRRVEDVLSWPEPMNV